MLLSVLFMFFCALLLIPFIVFALFLMFTGDAAREQELLTAYMSATVDAPRVSRERPMVGELVPPALGSTDPLKLPLKTA